MLGILDIDIIFDMPISKINGWKAYFKLRDELEEERKNGTEKDIKAEKAKQAAKNGGW
jgi:hypothetical protein